MIKKCSHFLRTYPFIVCSFINSSCFTLEILSDWKCAVRKRARILKEKPTGGGPPQEKPLNDLENKLLDLTGRIVVEGIPLVPELGLPNEVPEGLFYER
jgi:hypothetical protein